MELTGRLAGRICATRFEQLPVEVVEYSKHLMLSATGAMVAGSTLPAGKIMTGYVQRTGGSPEATVMGAGFRTSAENAALANGTFAHATEYEDDSLPEATSSFTIVPPVLALGEKLRATGRDVIEAFVVGNEVQTRVGIACLEGRRSGYLNLSIAGALGVAAAAARLLKLDVQQTTMALSLAAPQAGGFVRNSGTMAHYLEMGIAGRNGLAAAFLAAGGFTGDADLLGAPQGLLDLINRGKPASPEDIVSRWGSPFRVMEVGIKRYPCCYHMQRIIESVVLLKQEAGLRAGDVERVEVEVNPMLPQVIRHPEPRHSEEARFSLPHGVAAALLEDKPSLSSFSDAKVHDPAFREMRARVKTIVHEEWGWATSGWTPITTVVTRDGRRLSKTLENATGHPPSYLPVEGVMEKYRACTEGLLTGQAIDESAQAILHLEKSGDVSSLLATLAPQATGTAARGRAKRTGTR